MTEWIKFASIDPSLRNWGLTKFEFHLERGELDLIGMKLLCTEAEERKTVRRNSDDLRCAREIHAATIEWLSDCSLFAAEIPSGSQSARSSMAFGICLGVLASLSHHRPLIEVSISEAKKVATGRKVASKGEMIRWARDTYPDAAWITRKLKGEIVPTDANEHLADSCAIGVAATHTPEFKAALAMRRAMSRLRA